MAAFMAIRNINNSEHNLKHKLFSVREHNTIIIKLAWEWLDGSHRHRLVSTDPCTISGLIRTPAGFGN